MAEGEKKRDAVLNSVFLQSTENGGEVGNFQSCGPEQWRGERHPLGMGPGSVFILSFNKKGIHMVPYHLPSWAALCTEHNPPGTEGHPQHPQAFQVSSG